MRDLILKVDNLHTIWIASRGALSKAKQAEEEAYRDWEKADLLLIQATFNPKICLCAELSGRCPQHNKAK